MLSRLIVAFHALLGQAVIYRTEFRTDAAGDHYLAPKPGAGQLLTVEAVWDGPCQNPPNR